MKKAPPGILPVLAVDRGAPLPLHRRRRGAVPRFAAVREAMDIFPPTLPQAALADFLEEGHFGRHIRRMRQLYRERRTALVDTLER